MPVCVWVWLCVYWGNNSFERSISFRDRVTHFSNFMYHNTATNKCPNTIYYQPIRSFYKIFNIYMSRPSYFMLPAEQGLETCSATQSNTPRQQQSQKHKLTILNSLWQFLPCPCPPCLFFKKFPTHFK